MGYISGRCSWARPLGRNELSTVVASLQNRSAPGAVPAPPTHGTSPATGSSDVGRRLERHLRLWLGSWPPAHDLELVVWPGRERPGWDGGTWPGLAVESPDGTVLSLSPSLGVDLGAVDLDRVLSAMRGPDAAVAVPAELGRPDLTLGGAVFRWSDCPVSLPDVGEWVPPDDPRLPAWLRPFNGDVLVAWDEAGRFAAGVGRKRHNRHGHELAVATEPHQRGRGLARMLVAQAARRVLADGAVPLYLHEVTNIGSARVADATGFPDRGWRVFGLMPAVYPAPTHAHRAEGERGQP